MKVSDVGPSDAKIMLVGEAPRESDAKKGIPFTDYHGKLLRQLLAHSKINYDNCYVTYVVNERPPANDFNFFYTDGNKKKVPSDSLEQNWIALREKIERIKPNVVIPLGAEALRAITGEKHIGDWRGTPMSYRGIKVIPTYHPSYVIRKYQEHPIVELDFAKAKRESIKSTYDKSSYTIILEPTLQQTLDWIAYAKRTKQRVSFDIETVGKHVRSLALAIGPIDNPSAICIPFIKFPSSNLASIKPGDKLISFGSESSCMSSYWVKQNEVTVLTAIAELFACNDCQKVGQNSTSFDAPILEDEFGIYITNHYFDTMHAFHILYPELPKSLNFLCSTLTNYPNYWTKKVTENDSSEWKYNCMDAIVTLIAANKIEKDLKSEGMLDLYLEKTHPLAIALATSSRHGIKIDVVERDKIIKEKKLEIENVKAELKKIVAELTGEEEREVNPNSPKQVGDLLYRVMKFPTIYGKNKKSTVDEEAIRKLGKKYPDEPVLNLIITYRKAVKLISTYLDVKLTSDNRMITSYNPSGTKGARISSSKNIWNEGMDLQNIPAGRSKGVANIRHIFVSSEGNILVKGDLSQAETMVVGEILYRIGDPTIHDLYKVEGFDIHKWAAAFIFRKNEEDITPYERTVGKLRNHSGNYMAGPGVMVAKALKDGISGITWEFSKQIIASTFLNIPGLQKWWRCVEMELQRSRVLTTCLGRKRIFFGRLDDNTTIRDAVSWEPQSTVGEITNMILVELFRVLDKDCKIIIQNHDEVVVDTPKHKVDYVKMHMQRASIIPLYVAGLNEKPLVIPIEITVGLNWKDCK